MTHAILPRTPLSLLLQVLGRPLRTARHEWQDSQRDSIGFPSEAPRANADYPDWLGYAPEIQKLLR